MKVLRIKPMCRPEVIDIDGSLESLQKSRNLEKNKSNPSSAIVVIPRTFLRQISPVLKNSSSALI